MGGFGWAGGRRDMGGWGREMGDGRRESRDREVENGGSRGEKWETVDVGLWEDRGTVGDRETEVG